MYAFSSLHFISTQKGVFVMKLSVGQAKMLLFLFVCCLDYTFVPVDAKPDDGPIIYINFNNPYHISVYRVTEGSLTGVQNTFGDHNHDTITKDEEFTVLVDFSSVSYNKERKWYETKARFCYGKDIQGCVRNKTRSLNTPYLVRPSSIHIPVPFVIPFSEVHRVTLPDGSTAIEHGTVHEQFKTFEINGAKYDASTGILMSFSAVSSANAGKISGIEFLRDTRRALKPQPLVLCYYVEWTADGCVPGLDNMMLAYNAKTLQLKYKRWLKAVEFPKHRDNKYTHILDIPGIGEKTYLVFKDMTLEQSSGIAHPFVHLFESVEEQVNKTIESAGLRYGDEKFLGSGKYKSFSKHFEEPSYSAAMSGTEFRFFRASMSVSYLRDEANWEDAFKTSWKGLFDQSNKEKAMDFFKDYGTHYVVDAVMGGRQEAVFTVDYCKVSQDKKSKLDFETDLMKPYKFVTSSNIQEYYSYKKNHSMSKTILRDPQITCTGGNYLDSDVCYNLILWRSSVLNNPYPITMTLRPFYTLPKVYEDSVWLKKMYEEYLKADLDGAKLKLKAKCEPYEAPPEQPSRLSPGAVVAIVFGILFAIAILVLVVVICKLLKNRSRLRKAKEWRFDK